VPRNITIVVTPAPTLESQRRVSPATTYRPRRRARVGAPRAPRARATLHVEPSLVSLLRTGCQVRGRLQSMLEPVGLSSAEYGVLRRLVEAEVPLPLGDLAGYAKSGRLDVRELIDRLQARRLVERVDDLTGRATVVRLTTSGRAHEAAGARVVDAVSAQFAATMPAPDRAALDRIASRLIGAAP
jgi:DNA-binding MarR family transcriptional regulator